MVVVVHREKKGMGNAALVGMVDTPSPHFVVPETKTRDESGNAACAPCFSVNTHRYQRNIRLRTVSASRISQAGRGGRSAYLGAAVSRLGVTSALTLPTAQEMPPSRMLWNRGSVQTSSRCPIEV